MAHRTRDNKALILVPEHSVSEKLAREHMSAVRNRLLEIAFRRQNKKIAVETFQTDIALVHAKIALSMWVLKLMKDIEHPMTIPAPYLIPSAMRGVRSVQSKIEQYSDIENVEAVIERYELAYANNFEKGVADKLQNVWPKKFSY